jgi:AcrR family transcriptional regulator
MQLATATAALPPTSPVFSPERIDPRAAGQLTAASQRQRLLYGLTSCVAERGFAPTTIEAITTRAGVSKKTFYEHFPNKLACFLAAYDLGAEALFSAIVTAAVDASNSGADARERLRLALRAGLAFLVTEQPYARTFLVEILPLGPEAIRHRERTHDVFIKTIREWHQQARVEHPEWPIVPDFAYAAAVATMYGMIASVVATDRTADLPQLEDTLVYAHLSLLQVPASAVNAPHRHNPGSHDIAS